MNNSEQFRRECEARQVMKWPKAKRQSYYIEIEKIRGRKQMLELWEETKRQADIFKSAEAAKGAVK